MRLLYGINGTGNGHRSRAEELVPALLEHAEVDVLVSGARYSLPMPFPVRYEFGGVSFTYRDGRVSMWRSVRNSYPVRLLGDIARLPVQEYDVVITDFEPVSAWAAKLRGVPCIHVSHQASFYSARAPRPTRRSAIQEFAIRHFAPSVEHLGLHFRRYDAPIRPPIVRARILDLTPEAGEEVVVYLPAVALSDQIELFQDLREGRFRVFSGEVSTPYQPAPNVTVQPAGDETFARAMAASGGVFGHSGFELPSEAMHLGKPLVSMPIGSQYEQACNAAALRELGVTVIDAWDPSIAGPLRDWLARRPVVRLPEITEPRQLAAEVLDRARALAKRPAAP